MVGVGVKLWLPKFSMQNRQQRSQRQQFPPVEDSGRGNKTELFGFSAGNYCQDQMLRGKAGLLKESFSVHVEFFFLMGDLQWILSLKSPYRLILRKLFTGNENEASREVI